MNIKLPFLFLLISGHFLTAQSFSPTLSDLLSSVKNTIVCGHRGGYYPDFPENSLSLLEHVLESTKGVPIMFEIDIREDKDGNLWLLHDNTLDRTTDHTGDISKFSTEQIKNIRLKNQKGNITNEYIPSLKDLIQWSRSKNVYLMLDIKENAWEKTIALINDSGIADHCLILTFNPEKTQDAYKLSKKGIISALVNNENDYKTILKYNIPKNRLAMYVTETTPSELVNKIKSEGIITLSDPREVWNGYKDVLSSDLYSGMINKMGLNIIVTDFPLQLVRMIEESKKKNLEKKIKDLHLKKFQWLIQKQTDSLNTIIHSDLYYIHSNGWKETKAEMIHNIATGKLKYSDIVVHDSEVRVIENTAIVTGKGTFFVSLDDKPIEINLYYTEVYLILPEGIKLVSRHACKY